MNELQSVASTWFDAAWRTSWQAAVLIVLVLLVTRVLRARLSTRWTYALWCLVALRLLIPGSPRVSLGAFDWDSATQRDELLQPLQVAQLPAGSASALTTRSRPARRPSATRESTTTAESGKPRRSLSAFSGTLTRSKPSEPIAWTTWLFLLWSVGACSKFAFVVVHEWSFRRRLRTALELHEPELQGLLSECCADLDIERPVRLLSSELLSSPALCGWSKPAILLPEHVTRLGRDELRGVLLHELAHAKHADVAANALLAFIGCVWWFHPLVGFAFGELRSAREALRDSEALSTPRSPAPLSYAETLIELAEARPKRTLLAPGFSLETRETRRRMQVIANFNPQRPGTRALGASLLLGLTWLTFTSATAPVVLPDSPDAKYVGREGELRVVRHTPEPAWRAELEQKLEEHKFVAFEDTGCYEIIDFLRRETGANFIVQTNLFEDYGFESFSLSSNHLRVRDALGMMCQALGSNVSFALTDGVVFIGERGHIPLEHDLRFYQVDALLEEFYGDDGMDDLIALTQRLSAQGSWDEDAISIDAWNGLLLINQTHAGHASVFGFLNCLLNKGAQLPDEEHELRAAVMETLRTTKTSVDFDDIPLVEALQELSLLTNIPIRAHNDYADEFISLKLNQVSVEAVLNWAARMYGAYVVPDAAGIQITPDSQLSLEFYELTTLFERTSDPEGFLDSIVDLIRYQVEPQLWDESPEACILNWNEQLLVNANRAAHAGIAQLIAALEEVTK